MEELQAVNPLFLEVMKQSLVSICQSMDSIEANSRPGNFHLIVDLESRIKAASKLAILDPENRLNYFSDLSTRYTAHREELVDYGDKINVMELDGIYGLHLFDIGQVGEAKRVIQNMGEDLSLTDSAYGSGKESSFASIIAEDRMKSIKPEFVARLAELMIRGGDIDEAKNFLNEEEVDQSKHGTIYLPNLIAELYKQNKIDEIQQIIYELEQAYEGLGINNPLSFEYFSLKHSRKALIEAMARSGDTGGALVELRKIPNIFERAERRLDVLRQVMINRDEMAARQVFEAFDVDFQEKFADDYSISGRDTAAGFYIAMASAVQDMPGLLDIYEQSLWGQHNEGACAYELLKSADMDPGNREYQITQLFKLLAQAGDKAKIKEVYEFFVNNEALIPVSIDSLRHSYIKYYVDFDYEREIEEIEYILSPQDKINRMSSLMSKKHLLSGSIEDYEQELEKLILLEDGFIGDEDDFSEIMELIDGQPEDGPEDIEVVQTRDYVVGGFIISDGSDSEEPVVRRSPEFMYTIIKLAYKNGDLQTFEKLLKHTLLPRSMALKIVLELLP